MIYQMCYACTSDGGMGGLARCRSCGLLYCQPCQPAHADPCAEAREIAQRRAELERAEFLTGGAARPVRDGR